MNTFVEILLWNAALGLTVYAWLRFMDWVVKPWLEEISTADYDQEALDEYVLRSALQGKYSNAQIEAVIARVRGQ